MLLTIKESYIIVDINFLSLSLSFFLRTNVSVKRANECKQSEHFARLDWIADHFDPVIFAQ